MTKKQGLLVTMFICSVLTVPVAAQDGAPMLNQGNQELGLSGNAKISSDSEFDLTVKYGWFIRDGLEVGVNVGTGYGSDLFRVQGGLFTEYNFMREGPLVPFVGASMDLASASFDGDSASGSVDDDATALVLGIGFGVKYFFRPNIAITGSAGFEYGLGDSVFGGLDDAADAAGDIDIGLRVYF